MGIGLGRVQAREVAAEGGRIMEVRGVRPVHIPSVPGRSQNLFGEGNGILADEEGGSWGFKEV